MNIRRYLSGEDQHVGTARVAYPRVTPNGTRELTADQRGRREWRRMTPNEKIEALLKRIEALEARTR